MNRMNAKVRRDHRERLWATQKGRCAYCRRPMTPTVPRGTRQYQSTATIDHLISAERARQCGLRMPNEAGFNGVANVVLACRCCNQAKGDRTPLEFFFGVPSPRQARKRKGRAA